MRLREFHLPKVTGRRILFAAAGMVLGLGVPVGTYLLRLFVVFRGTVAPIEFFLYEFRVHSPFYLYMTVASSLILGAIGFYVGAAKGWLSQQRVALEETHDFYQARIEEEVLRAQKMEAVSLLAGGIAHDFNNILTVILGNLALARVSLHPQGETDEILAAAEMATLSAKELTQQLLTFSKGGAPIKTTTSTAEFIREVAQFASRGSNVRCEVLTPPDLSPVDIDASQITQVLNNLIINARQAMPEGGTVQIRAENRSLGQTDGVPLPAGDYVKIAVSDHGVGIPERHLLKIFDPYFTTKPDGSGLGLTIAHSIITKHDGYIRVESQEGVGTTFTLYLPVSHKEIPRQGKREDRPTTGGGKILVMDDEEMIRRFLQDLLGRIGYEPHVAGDGREAIALYQEARKTGRPFDCVIMDLTVPGGLGGKETIKRLLEIDPRVKAIVSSGYSNDPILSSYKKYGFKGIVVKPYRPHELEVALEQVIREEAG
ncbi:MAG: response regulator [Candidatus Tectomicrobia bacterium]|nr:response regulator [Candidatus Tectomicrobia bacterium]